MLARIGWLTVLIGILAQFAVPVEVFQWRRSAAGVVCLVAGTYPDMINDAIRSRRASVGRSYCIVSKQITVNVA